MRVASQALKGANYRSFSRDVKVKLNQVKMLKLRLLYLFLNMLRSWTSELKSATRTKSQLLGLIPCYLGDLNRIVYLPWKL